MGRVDYVRPHLPPGATVLERRRESATFGSLVFRLPDGAIGAMPDPDVGLVNGRHFLEYVEPVKQAKRQGRLDDAVVMLEAIVAMFEREADVCARAGVAARPGSTPPWYFEQLAIVYRKLGRPTDEVATLERYRALEPELPDAFADRLAKARAVAAALAAERRGR